MVKRFSFWRRMIWWTFSSWSLDQHLKYSTQYLNIDAVWAGVAIVLQQTQISSGAGSIQLTFLSVSYKRSCCFLGVVNQWLRLKLHLKKPVLSSCTFRQNYFNLNPSKSSREKISFAKFVNLSPINIVPLAQRLEKCKKFVSHYSEKLI